MRYNWVATCPLYFAALDIWVSMRVYGVPDHFDRSLE